MKTCLTIVCLALLSLNGYASEQKGATPTISQVKDFSLKSVADDPIKTFTLSEQTGKHVILHFLLKTTCPVCMRLTRDYHVKLKDNDKVVQVFIKPDERKVIEKWLGKLKDRPTIYHDPNAGLAKQYGVPGGFHFHGEVVHFPAFILLDPQGKEVFRHVGKNNGDRFKYGAFAKKFPELVK